MRPEKQEGTLKEKVAFFTTAVVGSAFLVRNLARISRYTRSYQELLSLMNHNNILEALNIIAKSKHRSLLLIETVSPSFPLNYFQGIENSTKYKKLVGKFYERLTF